ncbi:MAG TPA: carboxypeptidase-like regulatory domain-containing protein [Planctomycetota bacterium]|nr:carboxypeptidase-like regulatory domain-containing protein [Planctomycetota bacterium]
MSPHRARPAPDPGPHPPYPSGDVLERNLQALFAHSWEAVAPRAEFRARLEGELLTRVRERARAPASPAAPRLAPRLSWAALAAGIALVAGGLWLARERTRAPGLEELLARGDVAVRTVPDGSWRAWTAPPGTAMPLAPLEGGLDGGLDGGLELATPAALEAARLPVIASGGAQPTRVRALASSRLTARPAPAGRTSGETADGSGDGSPDESNRESNRGDQPRGLVELAAGGVVVELGGDAPWLVRTSEGDLLLIEGEARVTHELPRDPRADGGRWVRVVVRSGAVAIPSTRPPLALGPGDEAYLHGGEVLREGVAQGGPQGEPTIAGGPGRTGVEAPEPESPEGDARSEPSAATPAPAIDGLVLADGKPLEEFRVVLLREVVLPSVAEPKGHEFAGAAGRFRIDGVEPGAYAVFVQAPGYALWRRDGVTVPAGAAGDADESSGAVGSPGDAGPLALEAHLEPGVTLRGSVVDAGGEPIAGALVISETDCPVALLPISPELLESELGSLLVTRTVTGPDGRFELEHLRDCDQVLRADAPGLAPQSAQVPAAPAGERAEARFTLEAGGRIEGKVETATGLARPGHFIVASFAELRAGQARMGFDVAESAADGSFAFDELPPGSWVVLDLGQQGNLAGSPQMRAALVRRGETARVEFEAGDELAPLTGVLLDASGAPLAHRSVSVLPLERAPEEEPAGNGPPPGWRTTSTGADGSWRIEGLLPGSYDVYLAGRSAIEVIRVARLRFTGRGEETFELRAPAASLSGVVSGEGEPSVFAVVILEALDSPPGEEGFVARVFTDASGRYELPHLRGGRYKLIVVPTQGGRAYEEVGPVDLAEGEERSGLDVVLAPGAILRLSVSQADGGPVGGARVLLFDERGGGVQLTETQRTDALGVFRVGCLKPGRWSVRISAEGFAPARRELVLGPLEERALEVVLERPAQPYR